MRRYMRDFNYTFVDIVVHKWRSMAIRFMWEWCTGLTLKWVAPTLLQKSFGGLVDSNPSSVNKEDNQATLEAVVARALYSAWVEEQATSCCLRVHQEIALQPRKITYADVEVWSLALPSWHQNKPWVWCLNLFREVGHDAWYDWGTKADVWLTPISLQRAVHKLSKTVDRKGYV